MFRGKHGIYDERGHWRIKVQSWSYNIRDKSPKLQVPSSLQGFGFNLYPKLFTGRPSHSGDNMHL